MRYRGSIFADSDICKTASVSSDDQRGYEESDYGECCGNISDGAYAA